jgi:hypothetical protein
MITNSDEIEQIEDKLSPKQITALQLMMEGKTDHEISLKLVVTRPTVTIWRNKNPFFRALLNQLKRERIFAIQDKQQELLSKALDVIDAALQDADVHVAMAVWKQVIPDGEKLKDLYTDPKNVAVQIAQEYAEKEADRRGAFLPKGMSWVTRDSDEQEFLDVAVQQLEKEYGL